MTNRGATPLLFQIRRIKMNAKKAKKLRRSVREAQLGESDMLINTKTGVIRRGWGVRAAYTRLKRLPEGQRQVLLDGLKTKVEDEQPAA